MTKYARAAREPWLKQRLRELKYKYVVPTRGQTLSAEKVQAQTEYRRRVAAFNAEIARLNRPELEHFNWYHTVDLGNGLLTPGDFDYRPILATFQFPEDMRGLKVLDVGSATGYFAFEFEKRGADVVSVGLPSLAEWDMSNTDRARILDSLINYHHASTLEEATYRHLHGPFQFCSERLGSRIRRCYSNVYELNSEKLGESQFDLIFVGEVLLHLFSPLQALNVLAPLCRGTLVIATLLFDACDEKPYMQFLGSSTVAEDSRTWWSLNLEGISRMLERVGFSDVRVVCGCDVMHYRNLGSFGRQIIHARK